MTTSFTDGFSRLRYICGRRIHSAVVVLCLLSFSGCGFKSAEQDAEKAVTTHFQAISTTNFDDAISGYGPEFFGKVSKEQWKHDLETLNSKFGAYKSYSVRSWGVKKRAGVGTTVELRCTTYYSNCNIDETFLLLRKSDEKDFMIVGHSIKANTTQGM